MKPRSGPLRRTLAPRLLAGHLAVAVLTLIARLPLGITRFIGTALLPLYLPFRPRTRAKLMRYCPQVGPLRYYRTRLQLALLSIRHATQRPDHCLHHVENPHAFDDALATQRPVVLLGWHQGPVELLHKIPASQLDRTRTRMGGRRGFHLMTASAFSPPLADWMASGRRGGHRVPTRVIRPNDSLALREWVRTRGVLAVMIDQVPGIPEDVLVLGNGMPAVPWPRRLMEWVIAQEVEILVVTALWKPSDGTHAQTVRFRYQGVSPARSTHEAVKQRVGVLMSDALARAPEQYNWSYGKIESPPYRFAAPSSVQSDTTSTASRR